MIGLWVLWGERIECYRKNNRRETYFLLGGQGISICRDENKTLPDLGRTFQAKENSKYRGTEEENDLFKELKKDQSGT